MSGLDDQYIQMKLSMGEEGSETYEKGCFSNAILILLAIVVGFYILANLAASIILLLIIVVIIFIIYIVLKLFK